MEYREIPRGHLSTIILSTLLDGDKYGYEIIKAIEDKTDGRLSIKQPSLYSNLKRMEDQQLISSYWLDSEIGGKRHYYRLTDIGRKQTEEWKKDLLDNQSTIKSVIDNENLINEEASGQIKNPSIILEQINLFNMDIKEEKPEIKDDGRLLPKEETFFSEQIDMFSNSLPINDNIKEENVDIIKETDCESITKNIEIYNIKNDINQYIKEKKSFTDSIKDIDENYSSKINFSGNSLSINSFDGEYKSSQIEQEEITEELNKTESEINGLIQEEIKDDAVLITETTDISMLPKVKKIEPSIYESLASNSDLANKLFDKYYPEYEAKFKKVEEEIGQNNTKQNIHSTKEYHYNEQVRPVPAIEKNELEYDTNFSQIKNIYITKNDSNTKTKNKKYSIASNSQIKTSNLNENYQNLISSALISLLIIFTSLIIYLSTKTSVVYARFLFLLIPIICLIPTVFNLITLHKVIDIRYFTIKQYRNYQIYSVLLMIIIFAINMLFGMNFNNITLYSTTFLLLGISVIILPLYFLTKILLNKIFK